MYHILFQFVNHTTNITAAGDNVDNTEGNSPHSFCSASSGSKNILFLYNLLHNLIYICTPQ